MSIELVDKIEELLKLLLPACRYASEKDEVEIDGKVVKVDRGPPELSLDQYSKFRGLAEDIYVFAVKANLKAELPTSIDNAKTYTRLNMPGKLDASGFEFYPPKNWFNSLRVMARLAGKNEQVSGDDSRWWKQVDVALILHMQPMEIKRLCDQGLLQTNGESERSKRIDIISVVEYAKDKGFSIDFGRLKNS